MYSRRIVLYSEYRIIKKDVARKRRMTRAAIAPVSVRIVGGAPGAELSLLTTSAVPLIDDIAVGIFLLASGKHQVHHKGDIGTNQGR